MPTPSLPDFEHSLRLAGGVLGSSELAECHGVSCGLLCRSPGSDASSFIGLLGMLELVENPGHKLAGMLVELHHSTIGQMGDDEFGLSLWLPEDTEPLEDRTLALAQWCTGFLAGLGSGPEGCLDGVTEEAGEALNDLRQIAAACLSADEDFEAEEEETAYAEIVEYVRVVTLVLQEDLRGPRHGESIH